jgi:hypothetical protein
MRNALAGGAVFIVFVAGAILAAHAVRGGGPSRFRISLFILYSLGISAAAGFTRRPLFPFHHWPLLAGVLQDTVYFTRLVAVDVAGREQEIDFRAWEPMTGEDVAAWAHLPSGYFALDASGRRQVARYMLDHVEAARRRALAGHRFGTHRRLLGPLALPTFVLYRPVWTDPGPVPPEPFVGLRWIVYAWRPLGPGRDANFVARTVRYEFRPAP